MSKNLARPGPKKSETARPGPHFFEVARPGPARNFQTKSALSGPSFPIFDMTILFFQIEGIESENSSTDPPFLDFLGF